MILNVSAPKFQLFSTFYFGKISYFWGIFQLIFKGIFEKFRIFGKNFEKIFCQIFAVKFCSCAQKRIKKEPTQRVGSLLFIWLRA